jgi:hypothetical protein
MTINRSIADLLRSHATIETTAHTAAAPGKNLVQNGAMTVNQRGSTAVAADTTFSMDRYTNRLIGGGPARWTVTQDTTVPAGKGFSYSMKIDVTTIDASISTDDFQGVVQNIEAQNSQHLNFNHADASALTLTFWARTKKAGLHGGAIYNNDANRSLVFSWTAVADTWQKVTVAVPGDTGGVINNDTGPGLSIWWSFSGGKYMASDTGAWVAGAYLSVTSAVNDFDSTSNDVYITGVQLEVGSVATDFAHEDVGTTLIKCQRYYQEWSATLHVIMPWIGVQVSTTRTTVAMDYETRMRAAPSVTMTAADWQIWVNGTTATNISSISKGHISNFGLRLDCTHASGGASGNAAHFSHDDSSAAGTMSISAEL